MYLSSSSMAHLASDVAWRYIYIYKGIGQYKKQEEKQGIKWGYHSMKPFLMVSGEDQVAETNSETRCEMALFLRELREHLCDCGSILKYICNEETEEPEPLPEGKE